MAAVIRVRMWEVYRCDGGDYTRSALANKRPLLPWYERARICSISSAAGPRVKHTATEGKNGATRRWRGGSVNGWERRERERAARRRWSRRARARRASEGNGACAATNATRNLACSVALALIIPSRRRAQYLLLAGGLAWPCWRLCKLKVAESRYVAGGTVASLPRVQHLIVNCLGNSDPNSPKPKPPPIQRQPPPIRLTSSLHG